MMCNIAFKDPHLESRIYTARTVTAVGLVIILLGIVLLFWGFLSGISIYPLLIVYMVLVFSEQMRVVLH